VTALPPRDPRDFEVIGERIRARKGRQLQGWGLGIVVIAPRGLQEELEDVVRLFRAGAPWPFWQVAWLDASRAHLGCEGPATDR
jgi:hypothetical protein